MEIVKLALSDINVDPTFNCRGQFKDNDVAELVESIREHGGLLQPVTVAPSKNISFFDTDKPYSLLIGFRRFKAHQVLGWETIDCVINDTIHNEAKARMANLVENISRKDLTIIQEARAIQYLYNLGVTRQEAARQTGKSDGWVQLRFMLLDLPSDIQKEIEKGYINSSDIRELSSVMKNISMEAMYEVFRTLKKQKAMGKKARVKLHKPAQKKIRGRADLLALSEFLYDYYDTGFHTRTLAWASGEITNAEYDEDLREHAKEIGKPFVSIMDM